MQECESCAGWEGGNVETSDLKRFMRLVLVDWTSVRIWCGGSF